MLIGLFFWVCVCMGWEWQHGGGVICAWWCRAEWAISRHQCALIMLWWRQINSFMFINTTLEKTILFTLFTELLIKDLWTGGPQDRDWGSWKKKGRHTHTHTKKGGRSENQKKRTEDGGQSRKARSKSSLMLRTEGARLHMCACLCVSATEWEQSSTGKLGVKQRFSALTLFSS